MNSQLSALIELEKVLWDACQLGSMEIRVPADLPAEEKEKRLEPIARGLPKRQELASRAIEKLQAVFDAGYEPAEKWLLMGGLCHEGRLEASGTQFIESVDMAGLEQLFTIVQAHRKRLEAQSQQAPNVSNSERPWYSTGMPEMIRNFFDALKKHGGEADSATLKKEIGFQPSKLWSDYPKWKSCLDEFCERERGIYRLKIEPQNASKMPAIRQ